VPQFAIAEHHNRGSLRSQSIFVVVARDGRYSLYSEIKRFDIDSIFLGEWYYKPSKAAIYMKPNLLLKGNLCHFTKGVNDAVRKARARANDSNCIFVDSLFEFPEINLISPCIQRHGYNFNSIIKSSLVECSVG